MSLMNGLLAVALFFEYSETEYSLHFQMTRAVFFLSH